MDREIGGGQEETEGGGDRICTQEQNSKGSEERGSQG